MSAHRSLFITGTDTGTGKTIVTGLLGRYLREQGVRVITQKWVQTGCAGGIAGDIECHCRLMGLPLPAPAVMKDASPYVFRRACSPHLAARYEKRTIAAPKIKRSFKRLSGRYECVLVEGAGGVLVPYAGRRFLADIARELSMPVLLVAANRLGAINHALLSIEALKKRSFRIVGVVFNNCVATEKYIRADNARTVGMISGVPVLGVLPYAQDTRHLYRMFKGIGAAIMRRCR